MAIGLSISRYCSSIEPRREISDQAADRSVERVKQIKTNINNGIIIGSFTYDPKIIIAKLEIGYDTQ